MRKPARFVTFIILAVGLALSPYGAGRTVHAQIVDDFSDGEFAHNPAWTGDVDAWNVEYVRDDPALVSSGSAESDTISLAVSHELRFGRWTFSFLHRGVNLSTFNGSRVFVCAFADSVESQPSGYYVQFGTNNTDAVSLWHVDGEWTTRTELGRSSGRLVAGDSSDLSVEVIREPTIGWQVRVNGAEVIRAADSRSQACSHIALWVKHTGAGKDAFVFDSFTAAASPAPPPMPPPRLPTPHDVVINEIQFDPPSMGSEFIELYNRSPYSFPLQAFSLRDATAGPVRLSGSPEDLAPGAYAVVAQDAASFREQFPTVPYSVASPWPTLNNGGDHVVLEADGLTVDSVHYEAGDSPSAHSLERIDPDGPSNRHNFAPSGDALGATPGARNNRFERDESGPRLLLAKEIDDHRLDLHFDEPIRADSTPARLVAAGGIEAASVVHPEPHLLRASFDVALQARDVRIAVAVDLLGNRTVQIAAPISYRAPPSDLIVNEILYEPLADSRDGHPDQAEFLEIMNRSGRRVHVDGLHRTREPDEYGDADTVRVEKSLLALDPGMLLLLTADPLLTDAPVVVLPSLTLLNGGDRIRLHNSRSTVLDDVYYVPSWHHPDLLVHRGISLERIDPYGNGADPANWSSSVAPGGATPGLPNSVRLRPHEQVPASALTISPNPFSPDRDGVDDVVRITCVPSAGLTRVRLRIFDLSGMLVREVVSAHITAGSASFLWDGRDGLGRRLRTGIYIVFAEAFDSRNAAVETFKQPVVLARRY